MNKPIRCTTHFHACDCREYEFEMLQKENEELRKDFKKIFYQEDELSLEEIEDIEVKWFFKGEEK